MQKRTWKKTLYSFNDVADDTGGRYVTRSLVLRHQQDHYMRLSFELNNLSNCDAILPHWWMQEHQPANLFDKDSERNVFSSQHCREHCFSLENPDKPLPSRISATKL